jgi:signal transduction histidine kinase
VAEEAGGRLSVMAAAVRVQANRELLGQVVANLVDNALKHGTIDGREPDASVIVSIEDGEAVLTVADRGPGIAEADRERVVERFVRLETARSRPGSGLGLSLAAAVARLHGGRLVLGDNRPGLRVSLRLPRLADDPSRASLRA